MEELRELESFAHGRGLEPEEQPSSSEPAAKKQRTTAAQHAAELLAQAERDLASMQESEQVVATVDENSLKRMILSVERHINDNMQLRMKYSDRPERFMDSELALYQELKGLHAVAAAPELYPVLVKSKVVPSLLSLLAHENADICTDVIDLLHELADADDATPDDLKVRCGAPSAPRAVALAPPAPSTPRRAVLTPVRAPPRCSLTRSSTTTRPRC